VYTLQCRITGEVQECVVCERCAADMPNVDGDSVQVAPADDDCGCEFCDESGIARACYVLTSDGRVLVQIPTRNPWGFSLADEDQTWPGGVGIAESWTTVSASIVSKEDRDRLEWILKASEVAS